MNNTYFNTNSLNFYPHLHVVQYRFYVKEEVGRLLLKCCHALAQDSDTRHRNQAQKFGRGSSGIPRNVLEHSSCTLINQAIYKVTGLKIKMLHIEPSGSLFVVSISVAGRNPGRQIASLFDAFEQLYGHRINLQDLYPWPIVYIEFCTALSTPNATALAHRLGGIVDQRTYRPNQEFRYSEQWVFIIPELEKPIFMEVVIYSVRASKNRTPGYFKFEVRPVHRERKPRGGYVTRYATQLEGSYFAWHWMGSWIAVWMNEVLDDIPVEPVPEIWNTIPYEPFSELPLLHGSYFCTPELRECPQYEQNELQCLFAAPERLWGHGECPEHLEPHLWTPIETI